MRFVVRRPICRLARLVFAWGLWATPALAAGNDPCDPPKTDATRPAYLAQLIHDYGEENFKNPPVVRPISEAARLDLVVEYAKHRVAGCEATLKAYKAGELYVNVHT